MTNIFLFGFPDAIASDIENFQKTGRFGFQCPAHLPLFDKADVIVIYGSANSADVLEDIYRTISVHDRPSLLWLEHPGQPPQSLAGWQRVHRFALPIHLKQLDTLIDQILHSSAGPSFPLSKGIELNMQYFSLVVADKTVGPVSLTEKEAELLCLLARHSPASLSKELLLREIWGYHDTVDTHTLETHIYRLRGKMAHLLPSDAGIQTTEDGYRFVRMQ